MKDLKLEHRITARSIPEVIEGMEGAITRYAVSRRVLFRGRKLSNEAFINAAILHMLGMPPGEQEHALAGAVARLEAILSGTPLPTAGAEGGPAPNPPSPEDLLKQVKVTDTTPRRRKTKGA